MDLSPAMITALVAILSVIIGTFGGKYLDSLISKRRIVADTTLALTEDIDEVDELLSDWKNKYFDLRQENLKLEHRINELSIEILKLKNNIGE
jgi:peptidoglycan hydrolase CwlO-like protein